MVKWKRQILKVIGYAAQFVAVKPVIGLGRVLNFSLFLMSGLITNFPKKTPRTSMNCLNSAAGIIPPSLSDSILWMNGMAGSAAERRQIPSWTGSSIMPMKYLQMKQT